MNVQTMGMAVMLDVIINYVRSLQNQIEVHPCQEIFLCRPKLYIKFYHVFSLHEYLSNMYCQFCTCSSFSP